MDLKYLNTFRTIVDEGGFSKAAAKLNYTQSTVSFQIGQLEAELSAKLFERVGRTMNLTKAGEELIPYVDGVLKSVERMRCFADDLRAYSGELHIGVGETLLCYKLPQVLREFHRQAPNARLFLRSMNCYDIRNEILDGTLDLGIFYEDVGGFGASIATHPFARCTLALVGSPELCAGSPDFRTPNRQIPLPFIINEPNCIFRQIFERYLSERSIRMDHTIELWSIPTIKNLVRNDVGVSYLPRFAVQRELDSGALAEIPTDIPDRRITAVCGHHKNKWISPAMALLIRLIEATADGNSGDDADTEEVARP